jgi:RES domain-containing protein
VSRRSLIERLGRVVWVPLQATVYRSTAPGYDVLSGEGARAKGGRWNPAGSFPVVYAASDVSAAALEVRRTALLYGFPLESLLPRHLATIRVSLGRVLNLHDPVGLATLGMAPEVLTDDDHRICQALGDAAHYLGFEAVLAPSAVAPASTLAIFPNSLTAQSSLELVASELLDVGDVT